MKTISKSRRQSPYTYKFPVDRFELIEVLPDRIYKYKQSDGYEHPNRQHIVKLRCRRCGHEKIVCDKKEIGCKEGPCNRAAFVDRTGKRYGSLVALEYVRTDNPTHTWQWLCQCDCGRKELVSVNTLNNGKVRCVVCAKKHTRQTRTLPDSGSTWNRVIRQYRKNCLKRGQECLLTSEEMIGLMRGACHYCGAAGAVDTYGLTRNGMDRLDTTKGYVSGNVVSCCAICNIMKAMHSVPAFLRHIKMIYAHCKLDTITFNDYPEREYAQAGGKGEVPSERDKRQFGGNKI